MGGIRIWCFCGLLFKYGDIGNSIVESQKLRTCDRDHDGLLPYSDLNDSCSVL
jgi:hypothetical protein